MNNDEIALSEWVVNKVLEIAEACVDESRKGWRVKMGEFDDAMDSQDIDSRELREALALLDSTTYIIPFRDEDGNIAGISVIPQRFQCGHCKMWLNMQDDYEEHIDLCLRVQRKREMYRKLT
jgi:hypothetical protein